MSNLLRILNLIKDFLYQPIGAYVANTIPVEKYNLKFTLARNKIHLVIRCR